MEKLIKQIEAFGVQDLTQSVQLNGVHYNQIKCRELTMVTAGVYTGVMSIIQKLQVKQAIDLIGADAFIKAQQENESKAKTSGIEAVKNEVQEVSQEAFIDIVIQDKDLLYNILFDLISYKRDGDSFKLGREIDGFTFSLDKPENFTPFTEILKAFHSFFFIVN